MPTRSNARPRGAKSGGVGRGPAPLEETAEAIRAAGGPAVGVSCDIREPQAIASAFDAVEAGLGPANPLINNAAGNFLCASEDLSPNAFDAVVRIVLYGSFYATRELGRRLIARPPKGEGLGSAANHADA